MKAQTASTTPSWYSETALSAGRCSLLCLPAVLLCAALAQGQTTGSPFTRHSLDAMSGRALFEKLWVAAPASTAASDGLGPYYNARSCAACHPGGGQGAPTVAGSTFSPGRGMGDRGMGDEGMGDEGRGEYRAVSAALVMHLPSADDGEVLGSQLQPYAVPGLAAELAIPRVRYSPERVTLVGAETVRLRVPDYRVALPDDDRKRQLSPRLAPDLRGVTLLDRIPLAVLKNHADPADADGNGISGRLARDDSGVPARFGWRGQARDLEDQVARALFLDMGLSSPHYPASYGDCSPEQTECRRRADPGREDNAPPEVSQTAIDLLLAWLSTLRVVQPPSVSEGSREGGRLFREIGCADCHIPSYSITLADGPELIHPYTDLLLHDMGRQLADRGSSGAVLPSEWRTAPLWGLRDRQFLLHDGRATSPRQAILWHDGEAAGARQRYRALTAERRARLLEFLNGL